MRSDRYLSLKDERAKAEKLQIAAETRTFRQLLEFYYEITEDVTPARAVQFARYALDSPRRASIAIEDFGDIGGTACLLDLGCGSAGGLIAGQGKFSSVVGLDIALRWLVIGRKRLEEQGLSGTMVCADLESPPFAEGQFSHILALDVIEHVYDVASALAAIRQQLRPEGMVWLSANNSRWLGPHPSTGIWAAAFLSPEFRSVGRGKKRYDPLRYVAQLTPASMQKTCLNAGLEVLNILPNRIFGRRPGGIVGLLAASYDAVRANRLLRPALTAFGPFFQVVARAGHSAKGG